MSAKPEGGHGSLSRGWYFSDQCPAQLLAFVALDTDTAWLFTLQEAQGLAQQHSGRGIRRCTGVSSPLRLDRNRRAMKQRWSATSSQRKPRGCSLSKQASARLAAEEDARGQCSLDTCDGQLGALKSRE